MAGMTFSTFHLFSVPEWLTDQEAVHNELEQIWLAEEIGMAAVWLAEHNARRYGTVGSVQVVAGAVAATTSRIRIGVGVTRVPLHHPLHTAEAASPTSRFAAPCACSARR